MAIIVPFKGLLYDKERVEDLSKVMAPPYDVISPEFQIELYKRHPENIIKLILGKTSPDDKAGSDRYSRAAEDFSKWQKQGVLSRDERACLYAYSQSYTPKGGKETTRNGFIGTVKLEELGKGSIHPHEKTLSGPKADRLSLMKACNANFSCIFAIYPEGKDAPRGVDAGARKEKTIKHSLDSAVKGEPIIDVLGDDGVRNRVWRIDDPASIKKITDAMKEKPLFIADGHHRYETALNYKKFMLEQTRNPTGEEPFNYVMMYFTSMNDDGLEIWPTHRVVHSLKGFDAAAFIEKCKEYFIVEDFPRAKKDEFLKKMAEDSREKTRFGVAIKGEDVYRLISLKDKSVMDSLFGKTIAEEHKTLDVSILHFLILNRILGISQESQEKQENLVYVKDITGALKAVTEGANQLVFLMNPTKVEDVKRVSEAGLLMPQKSTYFYPKLLSGLVINPLWS
ncbi:MAG: DUF1015 domain-containing protein [Thermodesulfobacteriota bacterium]